MEVKTFFKNDPVIVIHKGNVKQGRFIGKGKTIVSIRFNGNDKIYSLADTKIQMDYRQMIMDLLKPVALNDDGWRLVYDQVMRTLEGIGRK